MHVNMQVRNHTADCAGQNGFLGRVVLPQIRVGIEVDQWFVLQTLEVLAPVRVRAVPIRAAG